MKETIEHIKKVNDFINLFVILLLRAGTNHDRSKLESPEQEIFERYTPLLSRLTYGSDAYRKIMSEMSIAIQHHYSKNSHHPEFYKDGISGMNLVDIVEMFCDWLAAVARHADGDIMESLKINKNRFEISDQLVSIFQNTVILFEKREEL